MICHICLAKIVATLFLCGLSDMSFCLQLPSFELMSSLTAHRGDLGSLAPAPDLGKGHCKTWGSRKREDAARKRNFCFLDVQIRSANIWSVLVLAETDRANFLLSSWYSAVFWI